MGKTKVYLKDSGKSDWGRGGQGIGGGNCKILERAPAGEGDDSFSTQLGSWTCVCLGSSSGRSALCFLFKLKNRNGTQFTKEKEGLGTDLFFKKFNRRRIRRSI